MAFLPLVSGLHGELPNKSFTPIYSSSLVSNSILPTQSTYLYRTHLVFVVVLNDTLTPINP